MFFWPTYGNELENISSDLKPNSSAGHDELPSNILSTYIKAFLKPLTHIINCSLTTRIVPDNMKIEKNTTVFKTNYKHDMNNYRPISILPYFSKIREKVVYKRTMDFVTKSNILYDKQFGFREKHSTAMALWETVDQISEAMDNKKTTVGVFIDLFKAFDTVDHKILLQKLENYGLRGSVLKWFTSYLENRQ